MTDIHTVHNIIQKVDNLGGDGRDCHSEQQFTDTPGAKIRLGTFFQSDPFLSQGRVIELFKIAFILITAGIPVKGADHVAPLHIIGLTGLFNGVVQKLQHGAWIPDSLEFLGRSVTVLGVQRNGAASKNPLRNGQSKLFVSDSIEHNLVFVNIQKAFAGNKLLRCDDVPCKVDGKSQKIVGFIGPKLIFHRFHSKHSFG